MNNNQQAYNLWASQYDTNKNLTRDLEATALRKTLKDIPFSSALEIGCGTGKNTIWLANKADRIMAIDFSKEMLHKAKTKIKTNNIEFKQVDITNNWTFTTEKFNLISFSLVLEHIQNLDFIFKQVRNTIYKDGYIYIGELHPFKQYQGSLARFDTENERIELQCYTHHISTFLNYAKTYGLYIVDINEWFDDDDKTNIPRILTILLQAN